MAERSDILYKNTEITTSLPKRKSQTEQDLGLGAHDPYKSKSNKQMDLERKS